MSTRPKYMIRSDMEGASGVVSYDQVLPERPDYPIGQRLFRADLGSCIAGLRDGGAGEIVIYDEHCDGRNIDADWLPEDVSFIAGKPPYRADWAGGLDASFAGLVMLGFHSKWGTPRGLLHHTYEHDICELRINGVAVGEIGMETAIAGDFGVPLQLLTADSAGCQEAQTLVPGVRTVAVKESVSETGGQCYPLSQTTAWIREAAAAIVTDPPDSKPWRCGAVSLEVSFNPGPFADALRQGNSNDLNTDGDLLLEGPSATAVWADYWQRKLAAFAQVS
ncbi:MAG: D-amino peptidase [Rhodothermales bacterium]|jgi:D-amino peptidase